jgi:hypothetical protein
MQHRVKFLFTATLSLVTATAWLVVCLPYKIKKPPKGRRKANHRFNGVFNAWNSCRGTRSSHPNVKHKAIALEDSIDVNAFTPIRKDYL